MKIQDWTEQIDQITNDFMTTFGGCTIDELNWKPNEETWSIGQNMDHLIVINESYFSIIDEIRKGTYKTPFPAKIGFFVNLMGKTLLKAVQPNNKIKTKTFSIWKPPKSEQKMNILERFAEHQSELKRKVMGSRDLIEKGTVISSPANKYMVYKLEMAFNIIVAHEKRHHNQAKNILNNLK